MTSRSAKNQEQKKGEIGTANEAIVAMLKATLEEHKTSLSAEFNASIQRFETKLDNIQSTINSHHQRITSLETTATVSSGELQDMAAKLIAVMEDNVKLKTRLVDLEGRSRRTNTRELVVRKARELRGKLKYKDAPIHIVEDYSPEVLEQRNAYREVMKELYDLGLKPQLRYPASLFILTSDGARKRLASPDDARKYIASHRRLSTSSVQD